MVKKNSIKTVPLMAIYRSLISMLNAKKSFNFVSCFFDFYRFLSVLILYLVFSSSVVNANPVLPSSSLNESKNISLQTTSRKFYNDLQPSDSPSFDKIILEEHGSFVVFKHQDHPGKYLRVSPEDNSVAWDGTILNEHTMFEMINQDSGKVAFKSFYENRYLQVEPSSDSALTVHDNVLDDQATFWVFRKPKVQKIALQANNLKYVELSQTGDKPLDAASDVPVFELQLEDYGSFVAFKSLEDNLYISGTSQSGNQLTPRDNQPNYPNAKFRIEKQDNGQVAIKSLGFNQYVGIQNSNNGIVTANVPDITDTSKFWLLQTPKIKPIALKANNNKYVKLRQRDKRLDAASDVPVFALQLEDYGSFVAFKSLEDNLYISGTSGYGNQLSPRDSQPNYLNAKFRIEKQDNGKVAIKSLGFNQYVGIQNWNNEDILTAGTTGIEGKSKFQMITLDSLYTDYRTTTDGSTQNILDFLDGKRLYKRLYNIRAIDIKDSNATLVTSSRYNKDTGMITLAKEDEFLYVSFYTTDGELTRIKLHRKVVSENISLQATSTKFYNDLQPSDSPSFDKIILEEHGSFVVFRHQDYPGKYLQVSPEDNSVAWDGTNINEYTKFKMINQDVGKFAFTSFYQNRYLQVEPSKDNALTVHDSFLVVEAIFWVFRKPKVQKIALQANNLKYVELRQTGNKPLDAASDVPVFELQLEDYGSFVAFKSLDDNKYVSIIGGVDGYRVFTPRDNQPNYLNARFRIEKQDNGQVAIKSLGRNHYVGIQNSNNGILTAESPDITERSKFWILQTPKIQKIALQANNLKYVELRQTGDKPLDAASDVPVFELQLEDYGSFVAFKSLEDNLYISGTSQSGNQLTPRDNQPNYPNAKFRIEKQDNGQVVIKSLGFNQYVGIQNSNNGIVTANVPDVTDTSKFWILQTPKIKPIALKANNNKYVKLRQTGDKPLDAASDVPVFPLQLEDYGSFVAFKSLEDNLYISGTSKSGNQLTPRDDQPNYPNAKFRIETQYDGKVAIKSLGFNQYVGKQTWNNEDILRAATNGIEDVSKFQMITLDSHYTDHIYITDGNGSTQNILDFLDGKTLQDIRAIDIRDSNETPVTSSRYNKDTGMIRLAKEDEFLYVSFYTTDGELTRIKLHRKVVSENISLQTTSGKFYNDLQPSDSLSFDKIILEEHGSFVVFRHEDHFAKYLQVSPEDNSVAWDGTKINEYTKFKMINQDVGRVAFKSFYGHKYLQVEPSSDNALTVHDNVLDDQAIFWVFREPKVQKIALQAYLKYVEVRQGDKFLGNASDVPLFQLQLEDYGSFVAFKSLDDNKYVSIIDGGDGYQVFTPRDSQPNYPNAKFRIEKQDNGQVAIKSLGLNHYVRRGKLLTADSPDITERSKFWILQTPKIQKIALQANNLKYVELRQTGDKPLDAASDVPVFELQLEDYGSFVAFKSLEDNLYISGTSQSGNQLTPRDNQPNYLNAKFRIEKQDNGQVAIKSLGFNQYVGIQNSNNGIVTANVPDITDTSKFWILQTPKIQKIALQANNNKYVKLRQTGDKPLDAASDVPVFPLQLEDYGSFVAFKSLEDNLYISGTSQSGNQLTPRDDQPNYPNAKFRIEKQDNGKVAIKSLGFNQYVGIQNSNNEDILRAATNGIEDVSKFQMIIRYSDYTDYRTTTDGDGLTQNVLDFLDGKTLQDIRAIDIRDSNKTPVTSSRYNKDTGIITLAKEDEFLYVSFYTTDGELTKIKLHRKVVSENISLQTTSGKFYNDLQPSDSLSFAKIILEEHDSFVVFRHQDYPAKYLQVSPEDNSVAWDGTNIDVYTKFKMINQDVGRVAFKSFYENRYLQVEPSSDNALTVHDNVLDDQAIFWVFRKPKVQKIALQANHLKYVEVRQGDKFLRSASDVPVFELQLEDYGSFVAFKSLDDNKYVSIIDGGDGYQIFTPRDSQPNYLNAKFRIEKQDNGQVAIKSLGLNHYVRTGTIPFGRLLTADSPDITERSKFWILQTPKIQKIALKANNNKYVKLRQRDKRLDAASDVLVFPLQLEDYGSFVAFKSLEDNLYISGTFGYGNQLSPRDSQPNYLNAKFRIEKQDNGKVAIKSLGFNQYVGIQNWNNEDVLTAGTTGIEGKSKFQMITLDSLYTDYRTTTDGLTQNVLDFLDGKTLQDIHAIYIKDSNETLVTSSRYNKDTGMITLAKEDEFLYVSFYTTDGELTRIKLHRKVVSENISLQATSTKFYNDLQPSDSLSFDKIILEEHGSFVVFRHQDYPGKYLQVSPGDNSVAWDGTNIDEYTKFKMINQDSGKVAFKSFYENRYLQVEPSSDSALTVHDNVLDDQATFWVFRKPKVQKIALQANNLKYVELSQTGDKPLDAASDVPVFELQLEDYGSFVAFKSLEDNLYISGTSQSGNQLTPRDNQPNYPNAKFRIEKQDNGQVAIKSLGFNQYVGIQNSNNGIVTANVPDITNTSKFWILQTPKIQKIALQANNNKYVEVRQGDKFLRSASDVPVFELQLEDYGSFVAFKSLDDNKYVSIIDGGDGYQIFTPRDSQPNYLNAKFRIEKQDNGQVAIKSLGLNHYVRTGTIPFGRLLTADSPDITDTSKFWLLQTPKIKPIALKANNNKYVKLRQRDKRLDAASDVPVFALQLEDYGSFVAFKSLEDNLYISGTSGYGNQLSPRDSQPNYLNAKFRIEKQDNGKVAIKSLGFNQYVGIQNWNNEDVLTAGTTGIEGKSKFQMITLDSLYTDYRTTTDGLTQNVLDFLDGKTLQDIRAIDIRDSNETLVTSSRYNKDTGIITLAKEDEFLYVSFYTTDGGLTIIKLYHDVVFKNISLQLTATGEFYNDLQPSDSPSFDKIILEEHDSFVVFRHQDYPGKYLQVSPEDNSVAWDGTNIDEYTKFKMINHDSVRVAFKSFYENRYLQVEPSSDSALSVHDHVLNNQATFLLLKKHIDGVMSIPSNISYYELIENITQYLGDKKIPNHNSLIFRDENYQIIPAHGSNMTGILMFPKEYEFIYTTIVTNDSTFIQIKFIISYDNPVLENISLQTTSRKFYNDLQPSDSLSFDKIILEEHDSFVVFIHEDHPGKYLRVSPEDNSVAWDGTILDEHTMFEMINQDSGKVAFKSFYENRYLQVEPSSDSALTVHDNVLDDQATFWVFRKPKVQKIALQANNLKYVELRQTGDKPLDAASDVPVFELQLEDYGSFVAFKSLEDNLYISGTSQSGNQLTPRDNQPNYPNAKFRIEKQDNGQVAIKSLGFNQYVGIQNSNNGIVTANVPDITNTSKFWILQTPKIQKIALQANNNKYVKLRQTGDKPLDAASDVPVFPLQLEDYGSFVAFKSLEDNLYISGTSQSGNQLTPRDDQPNYPNAKFRIETQYDGKVAIKSLGFNQYVGIQNSNNEDILRAATNGIEDVSKFQMITLDSLYTDHRAITDGNDSTQNVLDFLDGKTLQDIRAIDIRDSNETLVTSSRYNKDTGMITLAKEDEFLYVSFYTTDGELTRIKLYRSFDYPFASFKIQNPNTTSSLNSCKQLEKNGNNYKLVDKSCSDSHNWYYGYSGWLYQYIEEKLICAHQNGEDITDATFIECDVNSDHVFDKDRKWVIDSHINGSVIIEAQNHFDPYYALHDNSYFLLNFEQFAGLLGSDYTLSLVMPHDTYEYDEVAGVKEVTEFSPVDFWSDSLSLLNIKDQTKPWQLDTSYFPLNFDYQQLGFIMPFLIDDYNAKATANESINAEFYVAEYFKVKIHRTDNEQGIKVLRMEASIDCSRLARFEYCNDNSSMKMDIEENEQDLDELGLLIVSYDANIHSLSFKFATTMNTGVVTDNEKLVINDLAIGLEKFKQLKNGIKIMSASQEQINLTNVDLVFYGNNMEYIFDAYAEKKERKRRSSVDAGLYMSLGHDSCNLLCQHLGDVSDHAVKIYDARYPARYEEVKRDMTYFYKMEEKNPRNKAVLLVNYHNPDELGEPNKSEQMLITRNFDQLSRKGEELSLVYRSDAIIKATVHGKAFEVSCHYNRDSKSYICSSSNATIVQASGSGEGEEFAVEIGQEGQVFVKAESIPHHTNAFLLFQIDIGEEVDVFLHFRLLSTTEYGYGFYGHRDNGFDLFRESTIHIAPGYSASIDKLSTYRIMHKHSSGFVEKNGATCLPLFKETYLNYENIYDSNYNYVCSVLGDGKVTNIRLADDSKHVPSKRSDDGSYILLRVDTETIGKTFVAFDAKYDNNSRLTSYNVGFPSDLDESSEIYRFHKNRIDQYGFNDIGSLIDVELAYSGDFFWDESVPKFNVPYECYAQLQNHRVLCKTEHIHGDHLRFEQVDGTPHLVNVGDQDLVIVSFDDLSRQSILNLTVQIADLSNTKSSIHRKIPLRMFNETVQAIVVEENENGDVQDVHIVYDTEQDLFLYKNTHTQIMFTASDLGMLHVRKRSDLDVNNIGHSTLGCIPNRGDIVSPRFEAGDYTLNLKDFNTFCYMIFGEINEESLGDYTGANELFNGLEFLHEYKGSVKQSGFKDENVGILQIDRVPDEYFSLVSTVKEGDITYEINYHPPHVERGTRPGLDAFYDAQSEEKGGIYPPSLTAINMFPSYKRVPDTNIAFQNLIEHDYNTETGTHHSSRDLNGTIRWASVFPIFADAINWLHNISYYWQLIENEQASLQLMNKAEEGFFKEEMETFQGNHCFLPSVFTKVDNLKARSNEFYHVLDAGFPELLPPQSWKNKLEAVNIEEDIRNSDKDIAKHFVEQFDKLVNDEEFATAVFNHMLGNYVTLAKGKLKKEFFKELIDQISTDSVRAYKFDYYEFKGRDSAFVSTAEDYVIMISDAVLENEYLKTIAYTEEYGHLLTYKIDTSLATVNTVRSGGVPGDEGARFKDIMLGNLLYHVDYFIQDKNGNMFYPAYAFDDEYKFDMDYGRLSIMGRSLPGEVSTGGAPTSVLNSTDLTSQVIGAIIGNPSRQEFKITDSNDQTTVEAVSPTASVSDKMQTTTSHELLDTTRQESSDEDDLLTGDDAVEATVDGKTTTVYTTEERNMPLTFTMHLPLMVHQNIDMVKLSKHNKAYAAYLRKNKKSTCHQILSGLTAKLYSDMKPRFGISFKIGLGDKTYQKRDENDEVTETYTEAQPLTFEIAAHNEVFSTYRFSGEIFKAHQNMITRRYARYYVTKDNRNKWRYGKYHLARLFLFSFNIPAGYISKKLVAEPAKGEKYFNLKNRFRDTFPDKRYTGVYEVVKVFIPELNLSYQFTGEASTARMIIYPLVDVTLQIILSSVISKSLYGGYYSYIRAAAVEYEKEYKEQQEKLARERQQAQQQMSLEAAQNTDPDASCSPVVAVPSGGDASSVTDESSATTINDPTRSWAPNNPDPDAIPHNPLNDYIRERSSSKTRDLFQFFREGLLTDLGSLGIALLQNAVHNSLSESHFLNQNIIVRTYIGIRFGAFAPHGGFAIKSPCGIKYFSRYNWNFQLLPRYGVFYNLALTHPDFLRRQAKMRGNFKPGDAQNNTVPENGTQPM